MVANSRGRRSCDYRDEDSATAPTTHERKRRRHSQSIGIQGIWESLALRLPEIIKVIFRDICFFSCQFSRLRILKPWGYSEHSWCDFLISRYGKSQSRLRTWERSTTSSSTPRSASLTLRLTKITDRTNRFHSKGQSVLRAGS